MESENIDETVQEGGANTIIGDSTDYIRFISSGMNNDRSFQELFNLANNFNSLTANKLIPKTTQFTVNGTTYTDRPLLLSDLVSLMVSRPTGVPARPEIQNLFDNIPLAQYKHLPAITSLIMAGGSIDETTMETQEVSLPSNEEDLPSLDIIEPSSTGGSYKRSSHKKRKSTRIRTKKNKKL